MDGSREGGCRADVGAAHGAIAVDVGIDDRCDAGILEPAGEFGGIHLGLFCPAARGDLAGAGIDPDRDLARKVLRRLSHELGVLHRRRAEDHARHASVQPVPRGGHVADAAAQLDRNTHRIDDRFDCGAVDGAAGESSVQVDEVKPGATGVGKAACLVRRIVTEDRRGVHVPPEEADALAVLQIDRRVYDHALRPGLVIPGRCQIGRALAIEVVLRRYESVVRIV